MDAYRIEWKTSAARELKRIDRQAVARILRAVEALAADPLPAGVRKLQGTEHTYRIRVGQYRIIYDLLTSQLLIQIVRVRHRKDVYRAQ